MKALFRPWIQAVAAILATAVLWGCGGAPLVIEPIDARQKPSDLIEGLGRQIGQARANQLDVLSPGWFEEALATYAEARRQVKGNAAPDAVRKQIAIARAELLQAQLGAVRSRDQLPEVIAARNAARSVHAQQFKQEYAAVEADFLKLTRALEKHEFKYARERRQKVGERYRALELRAIEKNAVGEVRKLLQNAQEDKVQDIAPKTLQQARDALHEAETHIAAHRYDRAGIKKRADRARFLTQRALIIAQAGRRLKAMAPEDIALWMETFLFETTKRLQIQDRRNLSFDEQQGAILAALDNLRAELTLARQSVENKTVLTQKMNDRLAELENEAQENRSARQRLEAQKRLYESVLRVQQAFDPREADVLIHSDRVVIRLKGIRFPAGRASLSPHDHGLLVKLQRSILMFGLPEVVIEGHTDSSGSPESNRVLSRQRAEAVKQFLVDRYTLPRDRISAVGYGSARPIAPNDTAEGRSLNRRIDVIIRVTSAANASMPSTDPPPAGPVERALGGARPNAGQ